MCTDCGCSTRGTQEKAHEHLHDNPQLNDTKTISVIQRY